MIRNYFKTAVRNLVRNRVYSAINIAGLSLGLACAMLILLYIKDEVSYDRFHNNGAQVFRVVRRMLNPDGSTAGSDGYTGYPQGPQYHTAIPEIKGFVRLQNGYRDIKNGSAIQSQQVLAVDAGFLNTFTFPLIGGNAVTALRQPKSVVISEDVAKVQFGNKDAVGKIIEIKNGDAFEPYTVTAVTKRCPQNSSIKFDVLMPMIVSPQDEHSSDAWMNVFLNTFVVLNKGADVKAVEAKMKKVFDVNAKEAVKMVKEKYNVQWQPLFLLQPMAEMHLSKDYPVMDGLSDASEPVFSYMLSGIALFILLIACINFVNLTVARSIKRAKEIGIRKVIGSSRRQLIMQFLGESFIICFAAFALAVVLVQLSLPVFNSLANKALSITFLLDAKLVAGYIALFVITGLLAGFYPAMVLSNYNPVQILYRRFMAGGKNYLQKCLVVLQFALASFLIIATVIIYTQFNYLTNKNLGYDDKNFLVVNHWEGISPAEANLFKQEAMKDVNVLAVSPKNVGWYNSNAKANGGNDVGVVVETVSEDFLPLLKAPIIQGRNFSRNFVTDSTHSVLVSEEFVKQAGLKQPVGQEISFTDDDNRKFTIIGVVKSYYYQPLNIPIKPQVFSLTYGRGYGSLYVRIKPGSETAGLAQVEKTFKKIFPQSAYYYNFKSQENLAWYQAEAKWKQIILFGAVITIFISCIGLFGLSVSSTENRVKEIGVRKVLGASVATIVNILSKDFLKLVAIALVIAMPVAWMAAGGWLQNYTNRITISWWMFALTGLVVLLIAMATVSFQTIKAGRANPVNSLKE